MLKELLGDLWTEAIEEKLKDKIQVVGSEKMIPKTRLDEVILERDNYKTEVDSMLIKLETASTELGTLEDLKNQLANAKSDYDTYVQSVQTEKINTSKKSALIKHLKSENVLNPELLIPFYDLEKLTVGDDGNISGAKEKTESLKTQFAGQFGKVVTETPPIVKAYKGKSFKDLKPGEKMKFKSEDPNGYEAARKAHINN